MLAPGWSISERLHNVMDTLKLSNHIATLRTKFLLCFRIQRQFFVNSYFWKLQFWWKWKTIKQQSLITFRKKENKLSSLSKQNIYLPIHQIESSKFIYRVISEEMHIFICMLNSLSSSFFGLKNTSQKNVQAVPNSSKRIAETRRDKLKWMKYFEPF